MQDLDHVQAGPSAGGTDFEIPQTILRHFDLTSTPYDASYSSLIKARKAKYPDGVLFIHRLLEIGSIDSSLYPPTTPAGVRKMLHAVYNSELDRSRQDCYYYYLLRDYDQHLPSANGLEEGDMVIEEHGQRSLDVRTSLRSEKFASRRCLAKPWVAMMDAFWCLDNEQWEDAINALVDPRITELNFVLEIVELISTLISPPARALQYIQKLVRTTSHIPKTEETLCIRLLALASTSSLDNAFRLIRSEPSGGQAALREELWCWMIGAPRSKAGAGQHTPQGDRIKELVHIPLNQEELDHLISFLARPIRGVAPETISVLHDLVTLRLVHQGQYAEAIQLDRDSAGSAGKDADRQRRREMVREFISILPDVQRRALAVEGDERAGRRAVERENGTLVNGDTISVSAGPSELALPVSNGHAAPIAASGTYPSSLGVSITREGSASPAPTPRSRQHSPFTGPPRFASGQPSSPGLLHRVLSGPFALPRQASTSGSPAPKPRRRIIEDDISMGVEQPSSQASKRRSHRKAPETVERSSPEPAISEQDTADSMSQADDEEAVEAAPKPRRSKRVVSSSIPPPPQEESADPAPEASAQSPPSHRTRARQSSQPPNAPPHHMPGSFNSASQPEPVPEDEILDTLAPTPSKAIGNGLPSTNTRSRVTRSVSKAMLEDDEDENDGTARKKKKAKTTNREDSVLATPSRTRRSTRASTRASSAMPSEMGSPTPSIASTVGGRTRRSVVRGSSVVSQTPRQTRSRKN